MALNNKERRKWKKHKLLDVQDGIIGHHTGNLDNQSGDREIHLGNHGNMSSTLSPDQHSDVGCHDNSDDGISDGNHGNIRNEFGNVDHCCGNIDGSKSDDIGNHQKSCGTLCSGIVDVDGTNDGSSNAHHMSTDGSQSSFDGIPADSFDGDPNGANSSSNDATTTIAQDSTKIKIDPDDNHSTSKTVSSASTFATSDQIDMATDQNHAVNEAVASIRASENVDSDGDPGSASERAKTPPELQMSSVEDITDYLGKLWEFCEISKEQESKLLLTDSNEMPQDAVQDYPSTKILKTIPYLVEGTNPKSKNNEKAFINPAGKSVRSLLHEYCLKKLQSKPQYTTKESGVPKTPFLAIVHVDGKEHGRGMAASKKQAKHVAAQRTLEILLPKWFRRLTDVEENLKV